MIIDSNLVIRRAVPEDASALAALAASTFRDTYRAIDDPKAIEDYVAENFRLDTMASLIVDAASTVLVAVNAGRLVGYAHLRAAEAPPCVRGPEPIELARLYLRQDAIGKGNGARLMRAVHAEAARLGRETIWLGVYDRNVGAVEFYKRFGFTDVGGKEFPFGGRIYIDPIMAAPVRKPAVPGSQAIARHWRGLAQSNRAAEYEAHLRNETFPALRRLEGFVGGEVLKRRVGNGVEFLVITRWVSVEAIHGFAGADAEAAVVPAEVQAMMVEYDARAKHYEVALATGPTASPGPDVT